MEKERGRNVKEKNTVQSRRARRNQEEGGLSTKSRKQNYLYLSMNETMEGSGEENSRTVEQILCNCIQVQQQSTVVRSGTAGTNPTDSTFNFNSL